VRFLISNRKRFFVELGERNYVVLLGIMNRVPDFFISGSKEREKEEIVAEMARRRGLVKNDKEDPVLDDLSWEYGECTGGLSVSLLRQETDPLIRERLLRLSRISESSLREIFEDNPEFIKVFLRAESINREENTRAINAIMVLLNKKR